MKPKTFLTIIALLLALFNSESAQAQRLVILQKDGSKVSYDLDELPVTTFTTTDLVITTKTATINYPLSTIHRYTFEGVPEGIDDEKVGGINVFHNGDNIIVKGLPYGKTVGVYSVDGIQLMTKRSDGSKQTTLSHSQLPAGVYIIKADNITYKFTKR